MPLFEGKVACATGGGSGIGQAACRLYAREGAKVVVADVDEKGGNHIVRTIQERNGESISVRVAVSNPDDWILPSTMQVSAARRPLLAITVWMAGRR